MKAPAPAHGPMSTERKILLGFSLTLLILLAIGLFSYASLQDVASTTSQVMRTHEVLENIKGMLSSVTDLQGTSRGYVLTGREEYLDLYRNAKGHLQRAVSELRRLTADNESQQRRLDSLEPLVTERIAYAQMVVELRRNQGFEPAVAEVQTGRGKRLTDSIRGLLAAMEMEERILLESRKSAARAGALRTLLILALGSLSALAVILLAIWALQRDIAARRRAEQTLLESEDRYRDLVEHSGVIICTHDPEGKLLSANRAFVQVAGFERTEEVTGRNIAEFLAPQVASQFPEYLQKVLTEGRAQGLLKIRTRQGDERILEYNNTLRHNPAGPLVIRGTALDVTERTRAQRELRHSREDLAALVNDLQLRSLEINRLGDISDLLQSCQTPQEAYEVTSRAVSKMFPSMSGALCVIAEPGTVVESVATWGPFPPETNVFSPEDCWALRRGRPHFIQDASAVQRCNHIADSAPGSHLCVPMRAHGEALGIFYLRAASPEGLPAPLIEAQQRLAVTTGEQVGLALANLKLRETLRQQSIRDSLTGLFNRRYMEESLDRELRRAIRNSRSMSVLMLDIDHFKRFNDTFGHEAGDTLLRELGQFLGTNVRGDDIACRYGGEEFALILPEATLESARLRAEWLRENIKLLELKHLGEPLGAISLSVGVAAYPDHDSTARGLLQAADRALYRAKRDGRDRVVLADSVAGETASSPAP